MNKLNYLLGFLDYERTKETIIKDPFYFTMAKEVGAKRIEGGFDLSNLIRKPIVESDYAFPVKFQNKLDFFRKDGLASLQNTAKAISYFERVLTKVNSGKFKGTEIADFLYAVWGIYNLNYDLDFGHVAMVKEKPIGYTILKKASLEKVLNACIDYILADNKPNIWFFNNSVTSYIKKGKIQKKEW